MHRLRSRRSLVLVCIGLVVFAALLPSVSSVFVAILTPLWLVIPAVVVVVLRRTAFRCDEQPVSLLAQVLTRAPPAVS
jgi:hypothetical protein